MASLPERPTASFRSSLDRFNDTSSYRKGRCRREENDYRDLGPGMYDSLSMMELQQTRPQTMGSILGSTSGHRSAVTRKGCNWYPGRQEYPHLGPGVYYQASRLFCPKKEAIMFLPGSRKGFHSFLNCGRSKRLMGDAVLFKTAKPSGQHLGPGSYDLPSTLVNGIRPKTAPEHIVRHHTPPPRARPGSIFANLAKSGRRVHQPQEEREADVQAVRALPALQ